MKLLGSRTAQLIGVFGWLDTTAPLAVYMAWAIALGVLVVLALQSASLNVRVALLLTAAATVAVAWAIESATADRYGFGWQGRYTLPLAAGVPLLAALGASNALPDAARRRLLRWTGATVAVAQFICVWAVLVRFGSGSRQPFNPLAGSWQPPAGALLVLALAAVGSAAWGVLIAGPSRIRQVERSSARRRYGEPPVSSDADYEQAPAADLRPPDDHLRDRGAGQRGGYGADAGHRWNPRG